MKVVKIISTLDFGGIEKVFEIFARFNDKDRCQVVFVVIGKGGRTESVIRQLGYRVEVWNERVRIPNVRAVRRLYTLLKEERPDVVHTTSAEANFHGLIAAYMAGVPVRIAEEIGIPTHSRLARWVFAGCYRLSSHVIAISAAVRDYCVGTGEVPEAKAKVIYNPVEPGPFLAVQKEPGSGVFRILCVSRLHQIKNLALLIRAFERVRRAYAGKTELWIVGDGPERPALEELAHRLGIAAHVTFWGYQKEPAAFFPGASLFVLPSFSEGQGVALLEAMLTATPCVVTSVGGAPEFIEDAVNGWLMDPYDLAGLSDILRRVMGMPEMSRREIAERGRTLVLERFMPREYMENLYGLYGCL